MVASGGSRLKWLGLVFGAVLSANAGFVNAVIDSFGDVGRTLKRADPQALQELYAALGLEMTNDPDSRLVDVAVTPGRRVSARVGGASCALTTRLRLAVVS